MATTPKKAKPRTPQQRMASRRERLRAQGLRPVQHWVPDLRDPKVLAQIRREPIAPRVDDDLLADDDRIARESGRFRLDHRDQFRNVLLQHRAAIGVKRVRKVDRLPRRQRAEASIQMVKTLIDQLERQHLFRGHHHQWRR